MMQTAALSDSKCYMSSALPDLESTIGGRQEMLRLRFRLNQSRAMQHHPLCAEGYSYSRSLTPKKKRKKESCVKTSSLASDKCSDASHSMCALPGQV